MTAVIFEFFGVREAITKGKAIGRMVVGEKMMDIFITGHETAGYAEVTMIGFKETIKVTDGCFEHEGTRYQFTYVREEGEEDTFQVAIFPHKETP